MFLSKFETRRRVRAFDAIVAKTDRALRHPEVVAMLGDTATQLADLNRTVFLPDLQHGELVVPKSQFDTPHVALFPAKRSQLTNVALGKLVNKISTQQVLHWKVEGAMHATPYGISKTYDEILDYYDSEDSEESASLPGQEGTAQPSAAKHIRTRLGITQHSLETPGPGRFTSSRPVICIWDELAKTSAWGASTAVHEEVHAFDAINFAPLLGDDFGLAAGEFRAYHVDGVVERVYGGAKELSEVEAFRREHADPMRPFHPTQAMVDMMRAEVRI